MQSFPVLATAAVPYSVVSPPTMSKLCEPPAARGPRAASLSPQPKGCVGMRLNSSAFLGCRRLYRLLLALPLSLAPIDFATAQETGTVTGTVTRRPKAAR